MLSRTLLKSLKHPYFLRKTFSTAYKRSKAEAKATETTKGKLFNVMFDEEGRSLLLHHHSAQKYYKMNLVFLILFFGISMRNFYTNTAIFGTERLGKLYLSIIGLSIFGMFLFGNRHIKNLYLLKNGKEVVIETYSNFGLSFAK